MIQLLSPLSTGVQRAGEILARAYSYARAEREAAIFKGDWTAYDQAAGHAHDLACALGVLGFDLPSAEEKSN